MEISTRAKERFCKDCNIPLKIFKEPYFMDRLKLYNEFFGTIDKWNVFIRELGKYNCEQDYFEEYNKVKDDGILSIKDSEAYQKFNGEDMNKYGVQNINLPSKDIFKIRNHGRTFISIDMKKANFFSLRHYDKGIFGGANTWEEFIGRFTNNGHIINSKYIRQVILGNCNPKRHITYEKYLMDGVLEWMSNYTSKDRVAFFSNDEIVIDISDMNEEMRISMKSQLEYNSKDLLVPIRIELFTLNKIGGIDGYYKKIFNNDRVYKTEFKCLNSYMLPLVMREFLGEEISENDKVFYHEGLFAKFIEVPEIEINIDKGGTFSGNSE